MRVYHVNEQANKNVIIYFAKLWIVISQANFVYGFDTDVFTLPFIFTLKEYSSIPKQMQHLKTF